jgi:hypothetical protein
MYLNSTTTKGTKKLFMLTPQNTKGVKILPIMDTQVQPIAPLWIEDPSVVLS